MALSRGFRSLYLLFTLAVLPPLFYPDGRTARTAEDPLFPLDDR